MRYIYFMLAIFSLTICTQCSIDSSNAQNNHAEDRLWYGIKSGNLAIVQEAVAECENINVFSGRHHYEYGPNRKKINSTVFVAIANGEYTIADYLIDCGIDVNLKLDSDERSLLQYSLLYSTSIAEKLINKGADINYTDKAGNNTLDYAIKNTNKNTFSSAFELLLEYGAKITENNAKHILEHIKFFQFGAARKILKDLEYQDINIALRCAFLSDSDGVKNYASEYDDYILLSQVTAAFCDVEALKYVVKEQTDYLTLLKIAVLYDNVNVINYLLNECLNIGGLEDKELTYCIIESGSLRTFELLYNNGFEFSMQDIILGCIQYTRPQILQYMFDRGLDKNFETGIGNPLVAAVLDNNMEITKMLVESGADVNGDDNHRPLVKACEEGYTHIAEYLVECGADVNVRCNYSRFDTAATPLVAAVRYGSEECITLLLNHGADLNYKTEEGKSVYDIAEEMNTKSICELLYRIEE